MCDEQKIVLLDQEITVSAETILKIESHVHFVKPGQEWLIKFDPDGEKEMQFIDAIRDSLRADFYCSIGNLPEVNQDDLIDQFSDLETDDWWWELMDAIEIDGEEK